VKRIHYEVVGSGDHDVIICNGLSQSTANWRGIARSNPHFRWILFDARGCGKSPLGERPYSLDDHVDDLCWVLDQLSDCKPLLLGFSHGGRVATRAAAREPHRFSSMVLTSVGSQMTTQRKAYVSSWQKSLELGGLRGMAWATLPTIVGRKILDKFTNWELLVNGTINRNSEEGLLAMFEGMATYPPLQTDAEQISLPTLILQGGEDPLLHLADLENLASWTGGSKELYEDCGHTLPLEEPNLFVASLTRFISQVNNELPEADPEN